VPQEFTATVVASERLSAFNVVATYAVPSQVVSNPAAGQFVMVRCGVSHDPLLRRPFSPLGWEAREDLLTLLILRVADYRRTGNLGY
jgi:hypothetical protein